MSEPRVTLDGESLTVRDRRGKGTSMAKYTIYYENANLEEVEADKFYDSKSLDWIEFFKGSDSASRLVLRVKASKVWKIELQP